MIHWIHPAANLLLWIVYLVTAFGCIYFYWPTWGGWNTLNAWGKFWAIYCAIMCVASGLLLMYTTPYPIG